jgi:hypothetical protein
LFVKLLTLFCSELNKVFPFIFLFLYHKSNNFLTNLNYDFIINVKIVWRNWPKL